MRYFPLMRFGLCVLSLLSIGQVTLAVEFRPFSATERDAIDRRVLALPDGRTTEPKKEFYGAVAGWSVARTPLRASEERERAEAAHQNVLRTEKTLPTPRLAVEVLKNLTEHLPGVAPPEFEYSLTIIDSPEYRTWTVGGGFLYLSRPMYEAIVQNDNHAKDRLAFVLAHEIGHVVRKHGRRRYQLLKLQEFAKREDLNEVERSRLRKAIHKLVDKTGTRLQFLYRPGEEYVADLFAAHLCRNARFDADAGWDVLRWGVLVEENSTGVPDHLANAMISNPNSPNETNHPSASDRLRQLCFERDGIIREAGYGLWEFDAKSDQWIKPRNLHVAAKERVVLMVHGMDSSLSRCYINLARELAKHRAFRGHRILGFQYPGDASLVYVGEFFTRELSRVFDPQVQPHLVCHSAGGLVVRYYAEVKGGPFEQIILQGTPNHGSDWAALRPVVEMKQFVKDLDEGYSQAIENAVLDGHGQIAYDLQPRSLFLNYLNNHQADRSRYTILRGRRFSGKRMLFLGQAFVLGKTYLARKIKRSDAPELVRERALHTLEKFQLPEEVRRGDLLVSLHSAELKGVTEMQTFKLHHGKLSRDEETIAATLKLLETKR